MTSKVKNTKGFTIIEILMVIVLIGIVSTIVSTLILGGGESYSDFEIRSDITAEGRVAVDRMKKEMRLINCDPPGLTCTPDGSDIPTFGASDFRFVKINGEGRGFRLSGSELLLRAGTAGGDPESTLAGNVTALTFTYYDDAGAVTAVVADIWSIKVDFNITRSGQSIDFTTRIHPRSFI